MAESGFSPLKNSAIATDPENVIETDSISKLLNGHDDNSGDEICDKTINGTTNSNGNTVFDNRIKKKAKRPSRLLNNNNKDLSRTKSDPQIVPSLRALKNSRKSRNGHGRGLPKKGGAGGKGTWGALGSEIVEDEEYPGASDPHDPNYDEASLDNKDVKLKLIDLDKAVEEITKKVTPIVLEYFDHGDTEEVLVSLEEIKMGSNRHVVVTTAIELGMDHKPSHREMTSVLLGDLQGAFLASEDYAAGFDHLIHNLSDLILDTPDAPTILGNFIARAIADDCIPPKFLESYKGKVDCDHAVLALARAESLLSMRHGLVRLDNVWGVGGGTRPVKHLTKKILLLLQEYLSSADIKEATHCLQDLEVPHFHHELVYEAVNMILEKMDDRSIGRMCTLLTSLYRAFIVTPNQMKEGFLRIYEEMPQICLDVPAAYNILEKFVSECNRNQILEEELIKKLPTRGRKRFVSEGDGGRVKDHAYF